MAAGPAPEKPEKKFLGVPVWSWLAIAFVIALIYGFVFYSNSAKLRRHSEASILDSTSSAAPSANASSN